MHKEKTCICRNIHTLLSCGIMAPSKPIILSCECIEKASSCRLSIGLSSTASICFAAKYNYVKFMLFIYVVIAFQLFDGFVLPVKWCNNLELTVWIIIWRHIWWHLKNWKHVLRQGHDNSSRFFKSQAKKCGRRNK